MSSFSAAGERSGSPVVMVIAVDGPAAAGKGTLARALAQYFSLRYLDTGLLYRALGRLALEAGRDLSQAAEDLIPHLGSRTFARAELRTPEVDRAASALAVQPRVRAGLLKYQRTFAQRGAVLDGRDIGTVIFPEAPLKFFITASSHTRAYRRFLEREGRAPGPEEHRLEAARVEERDLRDRTRSVAPLRPAEDALVIETDDLDAQQVLERALTHAKRIFTDERLDLQL